MRRIFYRNLENNKGNEIEMEYGYARVSSTEQNLDRQIPVSYTHIDVYKRQEQDRDIEQILTLYSRICENMAYKMLEYGRIYGN